MILLSGLVPGKDIEIVYTGLRPGEKLYEELLTDKETTLQTHHSKIMKASVEELDARKVLAKIDDLLNMLYTRKKKEVVEMIKLLVPEYTSSYSNLSKKQVSTN